MNVLVTGGAGYIGSHMVRALLRAGHAAVIIDDLSSGHAETRPDRVELVQADVRDRRAVRDVLRRCNVEAVVHFASRIQVGESVVDPRLYWRDNLAAAVELLESMLDEGVRSFLLSSTAAVYGTPERTPLDENHPTRPINPYGQTKLAIELMLADYGRAYGLRYAALRYFNAAGAEVASGLCERHDPETHLIPLVLDVALNRRPELTVFGDDYPTPDGTCIRDYIHVVDLAEAHLLALEHLPRGGETGAFNLGSERGHSVREVIAAVESVVGRAIKVKMGPRRVGDPPILVASSQKAARVLGWKPKHSSLEQIVRDAWQARLRT